MKWFSWDSAPWNKQPFDGPSTVYGGTSTNVITIHETASGSHGISGTSHNTITIHEAASGLITPPGYILVVGSSHNTIHIHEHAIGAHGVSGHAHGLIHILESSRARTSIFQTTSEYTAPKIHTNFIATRLLTNLTNSNIMLQLYDTPNSELYTKAPIDQFDADSVSFYNDIVVQDTSSPVYNADIVGDYIKTGIFSDTLVVPEIPNATILGLTGSSHTISKTLIKTTQRNKENHLEIYYSTDTNNKITMIVYRDFIGLSYSLDGGLSSIKITNTGLTYPNEVTSIAIQNFQYSTGVGISKIWVGTLREGLKSYVIGAATWVSETDLEKSNTGQYGDFLFRRSMFNKWFNKQSTDINAPNFDPLLPIGQDTYFRFVAGKYEPVYVLGVINNPTSAGLPLSVYVDNHRDDVLLGLSNNPLYLYKYTITNAPKYTLDTNYNVYRQIRETLDTSWIRLIPPTTNEIVDVLKIVQYNPSQDFTSTNSGLLVAISVYSREHDRFCVELLKIIGITSIGSTSRQVIITKDTTINPVISIDTNKFTGLSTYGNIIFITEREKVWRYINNTWELWLDAQGTTAEKNFRLLPSYRFGIIGAISYLSGFRGFGVLSGATPNSYIGILNTDFGHVIISLASITTDIMALPINSKQIKTELFGSSVRDFQVVSESNQAISCGLSIEPVNQYKLPTTFGPAIRYFPLTPITSTNMPTYLSKNIKSLFYKNSCGDSKQFELVNKNNSSVIPHIDTDQLYDNTTTETVDVLKLYSEPVNYVNDYNFDWLFVIDMPRVSLAAQADVQILRNYCTASMKYNRLKFLLQATETVTLNNYILETDVEIPYVPDTDYQLLNVIPPSLLPTITGTLDRHIVIHFEASGIALSCVGTANITIPILISAAGMVEVQGTINTTIPVSIISSGIHSIVGTSNNTIMINETATGMVEVQGIVNIAIPVSIISSGNHGISGTSNVITQILVVATGTIG